MKMHRVLVGLCFVTMAWLGMSSSAQADLILTFGQTSNSNTVSASGGTQITGANVAVDITQIHPSAGLSTPLSGFLNFSLQSSGPAATMAGGTVFAQQYTGNFSITGLANGGGTNYLSSNSVNGFLMGGTSSPSSLNFIANDNSLSSDVIVPLSIPTGISLSLANIQATNSNDPPSNILANGTVVPFTASVSGTFSATASQQPTASTPVPEPSFMGMIGVGGIGWVIRVCRRRRLTLA